MSRAILFAVVFVLVAGPAMAEKIELENGDTIDVTIVSETEDSLVVQHPQLGEFTVPRSALKPPAPPNPGLFGTKFMEGWQRSFGFGFGGASGNSQNASVNGSLSISRDAKTYRGTFLSTYFYSSQNGVKNTNSFRAGYDHDFKLGESRWFLFGGALYQYDEFQPWVHRFSGNGGVGYDIFRRKNLDLRVRIGAGFSRSEGTVNQWRPEGLAGWVLSWRPFEGHEFSADMTYYPDFSNTPEFRLLSNAAYQVAVTPIDGLSLKFGIQDEYDSSINTNTPIKGSVPTRFNQKNNLKYFGNLVYEF